MNPTHFLSDNRIKFISRLIEDVQNDKFGILSNEEEHISKRFGKYRHWIAVGIVTVIFLLAGCEHSILIAQTYPELDGEIGAYGWAGVSFSQPVIKESVEDAFSLSPETLGEILWQDDIFWFRPLQAFESNIEYQTRLSGEISTTDGDIFNLDQTWSFTIREPSILYYVSAGGGGELWRAKADGSEPKQITSTQNKVFEFSSDRTGEKIIFTFNNDLDGRDLWIVDRNGEDQRLLLNCGQDLCGEPAWSMDGQTIAYTREIYQAETGGYQPGQVWTVNLETGQTNQLYQSNFAFGHSPSFSPDGKRFASYDANNNGIRILNLTSSQESIVPRVIPGSGDWSPDGSKIIFTDLLSAENEPFVAVYIVDLETNAVERVLNEGAGDTDFSQPRWSPDGDWVAVSLRPVNSNISKTLWTLRLDGLFSRQVSDDPSATFTAYQWDPWGDRLVYQRYDLNSANSSIWVWESGVNTQIIENGSRPQWLP